MFNCAGQSWQIGTQSLWILLDRSQSLDPSIMTWFLLSLISWQNVTIWHTSWYKGIVTHISNTLPHIPRPPIWHHRNPYGNVRKHLAPYDPAWQHTEPPVTAWYHLVPPCTTWHHQPRLAPPGTNLATGLAFGKVYKEAHLRLSDPFPKDQIISFF